MKPHCEKVPFDYVGELIAKKYEILGELECAKKAMLRDLSCLDKETLMKLRFILKDYDRLEGEVAQKLSTIEQTIKTIIDVYVRDPSVVDEQIDKIRLEVATAMKIVESINADINAFDARITSVAKQCKLAEAELNERIDSVDNAIDDSVAALEAKFVTVNNRINTLYETVIESTDNSALVAQMNALREQLAALEKEVDVLQGDVEDVPVYDDSTVRAQIAAINASINAINGDVDALETSIATTNSKQSALESTVNSLNTSVGNIQADIERIESNVENVQGVASSGSKIATGKYTGTGQFGVDNPNTLSFDFEPKMLVIIDQTNSTAYSDSFPSADNRIVWVKGVTQLMSYYNSGSPTYLHFTVNENTISWYESYHNSQSNRGTQMNLSNIVYHYIAIG